ncbi:MAG TPA: di-heme oxidoredictase family protein [Planctomycetota bacterium]|jgi:cytochrome c peroxidase|nr:di-heme oxidoredictase family protein [Planctomycetota bacterium]
MTLRVPAVFGLACLLPGRALPSPGGVQVGETPTISTHLIHSDIVDGTVLKKEALRLGRVLFEAKFNRLDGQGRPAATGNGVPTARTPDEPAFIRTSGPEAGSCFACHNEPRSGGGGDFVANVFVLAQVLDPVTFSVGPGSSDERNSLGMFGAGLIELLGREMTSDLLQVRASAIAQAQTSGSPVTLPLDTKGVNFGSITGNPDGSVDASAVVGVNADLILRPFHQKGVVRSIREFTVNAMNHHHGMQAVERFGVAQTGTNDFDQDGAIDELTIGDITAATLFQATLPMPGRRIPREPVRRDAAELGEVLFGNIGCASCHKPELTLNDPIFTEPYGLNPAGTFNDTTQTVGVDLTKAPCAKPRPRRNPNGTVTVRAFTDLKRHDLCDAAPINSEQITFYCNEQVVQGGVPTNLFLTRKLWDVGNSAPYGHRGDLTTITDAILMHGGEARSTRDAFVALTQAERDAIVEFLKTLQVLPEGSNEEIHRD